MSQNSPRLWPERVEVIRGKQCEQWVWQASWQGFCFWLFKFGIPAGREAESTGGHARVGFRDRHSSRTRQGLAARARACLENQCWQTDPGSRGLLGPRVLLRAVSKPVGAHPNTDTRGRGGEASKGGGKRPLCSHVWGPDKKIAKLKGWKTPRQLPRHAAPQPPTSISHSSSLISRVVPF